MEGRRKENTCPAFLNQKAQVDRDLNRNPLPHKKQRSNTEKWRRWPKVYVWSNKEDSEEQPSSSTPLRQCRWSFKSSSCSEPQQSYEHWNFYIQDSILISPNPKRKQSMQYVVKPEVTASQRCICQTLQMCVLRYAGLEQNLKQHCVLRAKFSHKVNA